MRKLAALTATCAVALLAGASQAGAARAPTYLERVTIMDAFNIPGRSWASRCVLIRVSTADARYALVTSPRKPPAACIRSQQVGNGFVLLVRATPKALRWRNVFEGSLSAPCSTPRAVRVDLLGSAECG